MASIISKLWRPPSIRTTASSRTAAASTEIEFRESVEQTVPGAAIVRNELQAAIANIAHDSSSVRPQRLFRQSSLAEASGISKKTVCPCPRWKRATDIFGATLVLIVLSPLLIGIIAIIAFGSGGPILFRQKRYGLAGRPFFVWKFRTIKTEEAPERHQSYVIDRMSGDRPLEKRDGALQLIPCGRLLRKLGFDELPQLLNVLKGEMSLVGPRPDVVPPENYQPWQIERFDVLPGITGLWQVSGKNRTTFDTMMQLDLAYIRRRSMWFDLYILLRTIPAILLG